MNAEHEHLHDELIDFIIIGGLPAKSQLSQWIASFDMLGPTAEAPRRTCHQYPLRSTQ